jgi:hypothetical protein
MGDSLKPRLPTFIPAAIRRDDREGWGRFLELTPRRARLLTCWDWRAGDEAELEFELSGQTWKILFRALSSELDADGYRTVEAGVVKLADAERLAAAMLPLLTPPS